MMAYPTVPFSSNSEQQGLENKIQASIIVKVDETLQEPLVGNRL
jgi:hypothetical protein